MAKQISTQEWSDLKRSLDAQEAHKRGQQQALFRLFQAIKVKQMNIAEELIEKGVSLNLPLILDEKKGGVPRCETFRLPTIDLPNITILGWVSAYGRLDQMDWLLSKDADVNAPFGGGRDAAWLAMETREPLAALKLIERGAAVNYRINQDRQMSRLMKAAQLSDVKMVRELLNRRARVNDYDRSGRTALHYNFEQNPYSNDDAEIGRLLIDWGGNANAEDMDGVPVHALAQDPAQMMVLQKFELTNELSAVSLSAMEKLQERQLEVVVEEEPMIKLEGADPGLPQLQKPPKFQNPRF